MSDKKPLVLGTDSATGAIQQQQIRPMDQIDPTALPYDRETNLRRLFRVLVNDLLSLGVPLSQELIDEAQKPV